MKLIEDTAIVTEPEDKDSQIKLREMETGTGYCACFISKRTKQEGLRMSLVPMVVDPFDQPRRTFL